MALSMHNTFHILPGQDRQQGDDAMHYTDTLPLPFELDAYVPKFRPDSKHKYIDAFRFLAIPRERPADEVDNHNLHKRSHAFAMRWKHIGRRGGRTLKSIGKCDIPFVRHREEVKYQGKMNELITRGIQHEDIDTTRPNAKLVTFDYPYDINIYNIEFGTEGKKKWNDDAYNEHRDRNMLGYFVGSHMFEIYQVEESKRPQLYARVDEEFKNDYEFTLLLCVPTPPVYSYHSRQAIHSNNAMRNFVKNIG